MTARELRLDVTHRSTAAALDPQAFERVLAVARWSETPVFPVPGRTAWLPLDEPVTHGDRPGVSFIAVKLKGVGLRKPGRARCATVPPMTARYERGARVTHVGFDDSAELVELAAPPAPHGGLLHESALREHVNAQTLSRRGVPSIGPLAVVRYPDLAFDNRPMGAVITLSPERQPFRAHVDRIESQDAALRYFRAVFEALGLPGDPHSALTQWMALVVVAEQIGRLLRGLADCGLYRYSAHLENFHFHVERSELFLTDLDSTRALAELSPERQALERLRDVAGALHKLAWRLHYFARLDAAPHSALRAADPFFALLSGYFPDVGRAAREAATEPLWRLSTPHLHLRRRLKDPLAVDGDVLRLIEPDRRLFYCLAMSAALPLLRAASCRGGTGGLTEQALREKAEGFLGAGGADYLDWLMR